MISKSKNKKNILLKAIAGVASSVALSLPAWSQNDLPKDEEVYELSPFTVDASEDVGYRAQKTLAGTRTSTVLADVAASVTPFTSELLEDISASNFEELAGYAPNMEIDNFDAFQPYTFAIRGVAAQRTRNFFALDDLFFSTDFYSTERVESARGPNAILFGIAKPGGVLNVNTKRAMTHRDSFSANYRFDDWGSSRISADVNKVIIENRWAVRFNFLDSKETTWRQSHERSQDDRFHLTTTITPTETSTVRVEWEHIDQDFKRATAFHTRDHMSYYLNDPTAVDATRIRNTSNEPMLDWNTGILYNAEDWVEANGTNIVDFDFNTDVPKDAVFMGTAPGRQGEFDMITATWEQQIGENISFEVTHYDLQSERLRLGWGAGTNDGGGMRIDLQPTLYSGEANPNYGKYFIDSNATYQNIRRDQQNTRATFLYNLDLSEKNSWFGNHTFTAYWESHTYKHHENSLQEYIYDYDTSTPELDLLRVDRPRDSQNRIQTRVYFDDLNDASSLKWADDVYDSLAGFNPRSAVMHPGRTFEFQNKDGVTYTAESAWLTRSNTSYRNQGRDLDSRMLAWQGKFMEGGRLIASLGYREDETDFFRTRSLYDENGYVTMTPDPVWDMSSNGLNPDGTEARSPATKRKGISRTASLLYHANQLLTVAYNTSSVNGLNDEFRLLFPYAAVPELFKGKTHEFSSRFNLFEGALQSVLTFYTLETEGEVYRASNVDGRANNTWSILDEAGGMIDGQPVIYDDEEITADYSTTDRESKGIELETTVNFGKNVSMYFTVAKNETEVNNLGKSFYEYFGTIDPNDPTERTLIGGVVDQWKEAFNALPVGPDPINNPTVADTARETFFNGTTSTSGSLARFENEFYNQVTVYQGAAPLRQSEYKSALRIKYRFRDGILNGSEASFGARFNSGRVIGATESGGAIRSDDEIYLDLGLRHKRKVFDDKAEVVFALNIKNLLDKDGALATAASSDGTVTNFRFITPRQIRFETSVRF